MRIVRQFLLALTLFPAAAGAARGEADASEVKQAMKRATVFMMDQVSYRGGFLWRYSDDLSQRWGELPARSTQIWVERSTPNVGLMLLEAYQATEDRDYLKYADRVARALIYGQLPAGGWHYFIDFDMSGVRRWYEEVGSQSWGWEEYYHFYGNATFDDDTTTGALRYLLRLYRLTLDPRYREAVLRGFDFILQAQYSNGAWPQRFPIQSEFFKDGHPDYTAFYTFNDDVMAHNIHLLLEGYEKLGDERYLQAARRGMDFYLISQLGEPQAGWAQQYELDMKPGQGRSYEPGALSLDDTVDNVRQLMNFYKITGDRRYLNPIPRALTWLESCELSLEGFEGPVYAGFYEVGTNQPIFTYYEKRSRMEARFWVDSEYRSENLYPYRRPRRMDFSGLRAEFERVRALGPEQARAEYKKEREAQRWPVIPRVDRTVDYRVDLPSTAEVRQLMSSLDSRGAWVLEGLEFLDRENFLKNPPLRFRGIDTHHYVASMYRLIRYLKAGHNPLGIGLVSAGLPRAGLP